MNPNSYMIGGGRPVLVGSVWSHQPVATNFEPVPISTNSVSTNKVAAPLNGAEMFYDAPMPKKPRFAEDKPSNTLCQQNGISTDDEVGLRRRGTHFIVKMISTLRQNVQESRRSSLGNWIGVSALLMHQFFAVHSIEQFEVRDIAAVCVFLASKTEDCPKLLEHVVNAWMSLIDTKIHAAINSTTMNGLLPRKSREYERATKYLLVLEVLILRTIGFNLNMSLPHPMIIIEMRDRQKADRCQMIQAYEYANEILLRTDWCLRYNAEQLADVCMFLAHNATDVRREPNIAKVLASVRGKNSSYSMTIPDSVLNCQLECVELEDGEVLDI
ncbi:cyclin-T1.1 [Ditylenchus destructor]|uniref:Cyclin-T1.1 n=1 Tax=Ditylenchus destructor TaxID=166010 RepID=A0AAD4NA46_9BILA|nr:cyclin-T1.1 [Ditylenchus destructor]